DPRCVFGRDPGRPDRHARPRLSAQSVASDPELGRGLDRGAGAILDADLSVKGERAGVAPGGAVSGRATIKPQLNAGTVVTVLAVAGLLALPLYSALSGN